MAPVKFKLQVYNAVIRSKLMYRLEAVQLTLAHINMLETFHRKGLRHILKVKTTYVQRSTTNVKLLG
eukprot:12474421-Prorocentrum_lima.AAC.1